MIEQKEIWLVMEYTDGIDVYDLARYTVLDPDEIATICHGVLSALSHLHNQKVICRDVKSSNIMVDNHGHVYLADLGVSILEGPHANTETGTTRFMAPEVLTKKQTYSCNADVWPLGMVVVQMVTGCPLYHRLPKHDVP